MLAIDFWVVWLRTNDGMTATAIIITMAHTEVVKNNTAASIHAAQRVRKMKNATNYSLRIKNMRFLSTYINSGFQFRNGNSTSIA